MALVRNKGLKCAVEKCGDGALAKGHCGRHYEQVSKHGRVISVENHRKKNIGKTCQVGGCNSQSHARGYCKRHYLSRYSWTRRKYGMTWEQKDALWQEQGRACAICRKASSLDAIQIDHSHLTGDVRGLLCRPCNTALGFMDDDTRTLSSAIQYLEGSRSC